MNTGHVVNPRNSKQRLVCAVSALCLLSAACGGGGDSEAEATEAVSEAEAGTVGLFSLKVVEDTADDALEKVEALEVALEALETRIDDDLAVLEQNISAAEMEVESPEGESEPEPARSGPAHWTYEGEEGPEGWAELSSDFAVCESGLEQSPIDISTSDTFFVGLDDLSMDWSLSQIEVVDNGHTIQANVDEGNTTTFDGRPYDLLQFHFHRPSEHTTNGEPFPMELHFVHADSAGGLAVVGVLLDVGNENPAFDAVWSAQAARGSDAIIDSFDLSALLPSDLSRYRYSGSLTTPPCSEGVNWNVLAQPVELSRAQIADFLYEGNARPVQSLNGRTVLSDQS